MDYVNNLKDLPRTDLNCNQTYVGRSFRGAVVLLDGTQVHVPNKYGLWHQFLPYLIVKYCVFRSSKDTSREWSARLQERRRVRCKIQLSWRNLFWHGSQSPLCCRICEFIGNSSRTSSKSCAAILVECDHVFKLDWKINHLTSSHPPLSDVHADPVADPGGPRAPPYF